MNTIIQDIKDDVSKVIKHSQMLDKTEGVNTILEQWYEAKKGFIDAWNGQLIYDAGYVEFELSEEEKQKMLNEFIDSLEYQFDNGFLAAFVDHCRADFFKNQLHEDYHVPGLGLTIPKGMKVIKAFKFFEDDELLLHAFQDQASMLIQGNKISGNLYLSVHPLDFLSASENTHNWRSCHALDGDYRAGNISYMLDKSTIMSYIAKTDQFHKLPNFPEDVQWNSKKWRMLLFFDEEQEGLMAGRQYPFFSRQALNKVGHVLLDDQDIFWSNWVNDYIYQFPRNDSLFGYEDLNGRFVCMNKELYRMTDLVIDAPGSMHYDDLKYSTVYVPWYKWHRYPKNEKRRLHFLLGHQVPCVRCGENHVRTEASMLCTECETETQVGNSDYYVYCDCCSRRIYRDDAHVLTGNGDFLCPDCYDTHMMTCDCCGLEYYEAEIIYNRDTGLKKCYWCCQTAENEKEEKPNGSW